MIQRLGHILLIVALLAATGGHWVLLQTVAWTNMLATNLQSDSFSEALTKTFDGRHPCKLCVKIAAGKESEKKTEIPTAAKKIEFTHAPSRFIFAAPADFWLQGERLAILSPLTRAPPVPPPRGSFA